MKAELYMVFIMAMLVSVVLFLIYQDPGQAPESLSLEKHSREIAQINEKSKSHQLTGDTQKFNDSKKLMQEKLKEVSLEHMGLEVSDVDLIDGHYPFRDSEAIVEGFGMEPQLVCNFEQKIPLHMQKISQTEKFALFAGKYSQYEIEFYIMDERNYLSNVHYGLRASNDQNQHASTYFHLDSCTGQITDSEPYFLHCSDGNDGYRFATFNHDDIASSLSSTHFCRIELDPWRQSLHEYAETLREQRWQFRMEPVPEFVDSESHQRFFSDMNRQADLESILWEMVLGRFDEQDTQDMIKRYERQHGSLPGELLELIGSRP